jgi:Arc/MetJ family transcription regulator
MNMLLFQHVQKCYALCETSDADEHAMRVTVLLQIFITRISSLQESVDYKNQND